MIPQRKRSCARVIPYFAPVPALFLLASTAGAQTTPRILHDGVKCIVAGQHAILDALVEPADDLVTVKVYFRAEIYPAFFYVEMSRVGDRFQAVLPRPSPDIQAVVYYLEAIDTAFNSLRTEEYRPRVATDAQDCADDGPPVAYLEGPASITVGATAAGSNFPPGFLTDGIIATITTAGRVVGEGGAGTLIAVGAAAGAAAGVGILVAGGDDSATTTAPAGIATTSALTTVSTTSTTPPSAEPILACFDTEPNPPTIPVGGTVRFDATCSRPERERIVLYSWTFGDGRDGREGRVVTRVYPSPGVFPAELTITDDQGRQDRISKDVRVQEVAGPGPTPGPGPGPPPTVPGTSDREIVSLSGPFTPIPVGSTATYNVSFINNGPDLDPTVRVVISINASGAGAAPILVSAAGCSTSPGGGSLLADCFIGSLAAGAGGSRTISVQYPSMDTYRIEATIFGGTSDPNGGNNSKSLNTPVALRTLIASETSFLSEIRSSTPGQVQATIELNEADTSIASDGGPARHALKGRRGQNVLVGYALGSLDGALWRLDFGATEGFVPGSILVDSGDVVSAGARSVVFRLGGSEARIRFRFRLEP